MYRAVLRQQWMLYSPVVLIGTIIATLLPIAQVMLTGAASLEGGAEDALQMLSAQEVVVGGYPMLAIFGGLVMAALCLQDDQIGKHVYSLILPVPRWYYLLLRLGAGLTLVAVPAIALWIAALYASTQVRLPEGLHAYPTGLAVRFALCASLAFCIMFAIVSSSKRTRIGVASVFAGVMLIAIILSILGYSKLVETAFDRAFTWPSVADAFLARWRLIDV